MQNTLKACELLSGSLSGGVVNLVSSVVLSFPLSSAAIAARHRYCSAPHAGAGEVMLSLRMSLSKPYSLTGAVMEVSGSFF